MGYDISSNRFLGICCKHGCSIYLCHNLVSDHNSHTKLGEKQQSKITFHHLNKLKKKNKKTHACTSALLSSLQVILTLKIQQKQTTSRQNTFCTRLLSFTRERKSITSPLGSKVQHLPHLQVGEAYAEIWPDASVLLTAHLFQSNLSDTELLHCPLSAVHTWKSYIKHSQNCFQR